MNNWISRAITQIEANFAQLLNDQQIEKFYQSGFLEPL